MNEKTAAETVIKEINNNNNSNNNNNKNNNFGDKLLLSFGARFQR